MESFHVNIFLIFMYCLFVLELLVTAKGYTNTTIKTIKEEVLSQVNIKKN